MASLLSCLVVPGGWVCLVVSCVKFTFSITASSPSMNDDTIDFLLRGIKCEWRLLRISGLRSIPELCVSSCPTLSFCRLKGLAQEVILSEPSMLFEQSAKTTARIERELWFAVVVSYMYCSNRYEDEVVIICLSKLSQWLSSSSESGAFTCT